MAPHLLLQKSQEELLEMFVTAAIAEKQLQAAFENAKAGEHLAGLTAALASATTNLVGATVASRSSQCSSLQ
jgi:hypothetical protein